MQEGGGGGGGGALYSWYAKFVETLGIEDCPFSYFVFVPLQTVPGGWYSE